MHIIVFLVCLCWVPSPSRTWDLEMVFDVALFFLCDVCMRVRGMAHPAGRNPELEKLEYAWSCMRANWAWMEMNEGYMFLAT